MPTRKLLVSGASGFVGRFLLERLQPGETDSIVALHHRNLQDNSRSASHPAVTWLQADLTSDDLTSLVQGTDTVFHLAASFSLSKKTTDLQKMERVNVLGTQRLAEACKTAGVRHFIFSSSVAACEATSSYGRTKKAAENLLLSMMESGFNATILRAPALFGEHHQGSILELARAIKKNRFAIFGDGENRTHFYYVKDFVETLVSVSENPNTYGKTFLAADKPYTLKELTRILADLLGHKKKIPHLPKALGRALAGICDTVTALTGMSLPLSNRRYQAMLRDVAYPNDKQYPTLQTKPVYGLAEGLKRTVEYYRTSGLL